jgi:hypothetical protein
MLKGRLLRRSSANVKGWMLMSDEAYEKNTKKQYEALGRFVEAFERMVS